MALGVAELNRQIQALLESTFLHVQVEGEVSRPTYHASGHLYFTLKDKESAISCVMFKGNASKLKFQIEEGMSVVIDGSISVYAPRGSYQINCVHVEPSGAGALSYAYEQLKLKLEKKGYFQNKKPLPKFPSHIALITSQSGAALQDMLQVAKKRWALTKLTLIPALVQGEGAADAISRAIKQADTLKCDIIVIARGGGSVEDLWAFNEEAVADAVYEAKTPIVSAVGHEIDYVISDFVADLRAPTPSAAMEMILPEKNEFLQTIDFKIAQFIAVQKKILSQKRELLSHIAELYRKSSFEFRFNLRAEQTSSLKDLLNRAILARFAANETLKNELYQHLNIKISGNLSLKEGILKSFQNTYALKEPTKESRDGFAQIVKNSHKTALEKINEGDEFELQTPQTKISAKALKKSSLA